MLNKNFFTMEELVKHPDWPIKSSITVKKMIETGKLKAVDVSCSEKKTKSGKKYVRYRIYKESVAEFLSSKLGERHARRFKKKLKK